MLCKIINIFSENLKWKYGLTCINIYNVFIMNMLEK